MGHSPERQPPCRTPPPRSSRPSASRSASARSRPWPASTSSPPAGEVLAILGPNGAGKIDLRPGRGDAAAPQQRPPAGGRHRRGAPSRAGAPRHRPRRPVRLGRRGADRPREPGAWWPACSGIRRRTAKSQRVIGARAARPEPTTATGWCAPTRAACGAGSTSAPAWSARRSSCSSTSPRPASTRRSRHRAVGRHPGPRGRRHRRAAHHAVPRRGRSAGQPDRHRRPRPGDRSRDAVGAEGSGRPRGRGGSTFATTPTCRSPPPPWRASAWASRASTHRPAASPSPSIGGPDRLVDAVRILGDWDVRPR